ncbi:MAG TPA: LacI family DNA-binding transcriptional regulator [Anaerolineaceae bacterium]|nr:LacI family DNA-binding transcriptional regulator [Anaerolineaceae bacterium]
MKITIGEIANLAGVSKTTVSRVLNKKPDVDPATRERILALISEYDFQPNAFAKAISTQSNHYIGLLIPHKAEYIFSNSFYTEVMRGVSTEVDGCNYYLLICYAHDVNYLDIYRQKRVAGFVLLSPGSYHKGIIESLKTENIPFVSTAKVTNEEMVYVDIDNFHGGSLVMEHLVLLGHERIAYIGKPTLISSIERMNSHQAVLEKHGLPYDPSLVLVTHNSSIEDGYQSTQELLKHPNPPTAIFLANDIMAVGAIKAIHQAGLRVPEDISVAGFDDIPLASYSNPPLTTIRQPAYEKGAVATRLLIQLLEKQETPSSNILDVELVVRGSTGPVRNR